MTKELPAVREGQVWADNDRRSAGRHVLVLEVVGEFGARPFSARVTQCAPDGTHGGGRESWIALRRFRPNSTGYRLVRDVGDQPEPWVAGYKAALARAFATNAWIPASVNNGPWDFDAARAMGAHAAECPDWTLVEMLDEFEWAEFAGTFAEPPWADKSAARARVSCGCGRYVGTEVCYLGSFSEIVQSVLREAGA
jgi:hypothetical protein